ncbi:MAG: YihY/virulence factor BrkB family protein [Thermoleophilaceae bacterium]|jgi:membrane protein|nr:YihY/virulence factor BrkB family protein [Thermoleophilaceae bacterium]
MATRPEPGVRDPAGANGPGRLGGRRWIATLKRTIREFQDDDITDRAAALTYYSVLALFPALIALVSIVGLVADPRTVTDSLDQIVSDLGPASASETFSGPIRSITSNRGAAGVLFVVGVVGALNAASSYVGAFIRASNVIYEVEEGRPFWRLRPLQLGVTLIMLMAVALVFLALVLSGPLAESVGEAIGLSDVAVTVYGLAKWPILAALVLTMLGLLYYIAPNARITGIRWITPGSVLALVLWVLASAAFALFVANFGSYDKTYGTLGGVVTFLVWLWLTNIAVLLGAELNAELERSRELEAGVPGAEESLQLPHREAPDD